MNRRGFLAALGVAPAALVPTMAVASAPQEFDYGRTFYAPLSDDVRAAIDSYDERTLLYDFRKVWADARMGSMFGRCNSAFTVASCGRTDRLDVEFVRSLIPRINAAHAADVENLTSPIMRYAMSRLGVIPEWIGPLVATDFGLSAAGEAHRFKILVPGADVKVPYCPGIVASALT